jgi:predicted  nucleic acid-binding Zn-ribbon protein
MKGKCIDCGTIFYGVSAIDPNKRKCIKCGGWIHIMENVPPEKLANVPLRSMSLREERED